MDAKAFEARLKAEGFPEIRTNAYEPNRHNPEHTHPFDVRIYLSDAGRVREDLQWEPQRTPEQIVTETCEWIAAEETTLKPILVPDA